VEEHYAERLTLQAAARAAGLEKTYFCKYFRRMTGMGYRDWLSRARIERAIELLREGDLTITTVALEVGFADLRTFERAFRRLTGSCARSFRSQFRSARKPAAGGPIGA
jgi:AraC-like DNA-binding protein